MALMERALTEVLSAVVDNRGRSCPTVTSGFPLIATNCVKDDRLYPTFDNVRYIDQNTYDNWFRGHPEPGDILFVCKGSPGRIALVPDPVTFAIAQDMVSLRADSRVIHNRYLYYVLRSRTVQDKIVNMHVGTMIPHFKKGDFGKLHFAIHESLAEQQAIAEVLGALDDKIAANTKLAVTADEYLGAQFRREMDDGFESSDLGTIAEVNAESVKPVDGGQLRYIDIASVGVGAHAYPDLASWGDAPSRARRRVRKGDTLWSTVRPNRRSHSLNLSDDPRLVASTGLAVLSPRGVGFAYLYEATRLAEFTTYLENVAEGSTYPAVRAELFKSAPVPLISPDRRAAFEALAAPIRRYLHSLSEENRALAEMRDILLPQLMSGDLRVRTSTKGT